MPELFAYRHAFHSWLARIDFPRMDVKNRRPSLAIASLKPKAGVGVWEQPKVAPATAGHHHFAKRKTAHGEFRNAGDGLMYA
jgi:hypothetical protein